MSIRERLASPLRSRGLRRAFVQVHLWSGIALSLYIIMVCVSGSVIVFRRELDKAFCPTHVTVPVQGRRLSPAELKAKARAAYPRFDPREIEVGAAGAPDAPLEIRFSGEGVRVERLFNPYTGD